MSFLGWLIQEINILDPSLILFYGLEASNFKINPGLNIRNSKKEEASKFLVITFEQSSAHEMDQQNSILVKALQISLTHGLLIPEGLHLWEALAPIFHRVVLVHF
jgi:hypothetical protein